MPKCKKTFPKWEVLLWCEYTDGLDMSIDGTFFIILGKESIIPYIEGRVIAVWHSEGKGVIVYMCLNVSITRNIILITCYYRTVYSVFYSYALWYW